MVIVLESKCYLVCLFFIVFADILISIFVKTSKTAIITKTINIILIVVVQPCTP